MSLFPQTVLTTAYFPPVEYFWAIAASDAVYIEQHETYQKQSYRSRCRIFATGGVETLSIPVLCAATHKMPVRDVRIDYNDPWLMRHKRALEAAYNSSAFFAYYRDELYAVLDRREPFLFDLNMRLLEVLLRMTGLRREIRLTDYYEPDAGPGDFRARIQPKYHGESLLSEYKKEKTYFQVFSAGASFIPNLSVIDLLCAEGPDAISYLL